MARIDYIDDPNAPEANSVVPSVVAVVEDDHGRILLIHKADNDLWALPGGGHDVGESIGETVVREVREETGYEVEVIGIIGTYTNPNHVMAYDDGEVRQQFSIAFSAKLVGGEARTSEESREVDWVEPADLDRRQIHPSMRMRIQHYLDRRASPYIG
jgi:ADP-ribose pyrophosphatase YjhB (NUDIX family)